MTPEEIAHHIDFVQREYLRCIAATEDPIEQRNALLVYFAQHAIRTARIHFEETLADRGRTAHLGGADFMAHAEVTFHEFLSVIRQFCVDRDIVDVQFRVLCAELARASFFGELEKQMHTVSTKGSA